jgi:SprT-like family
MTSCGGTCQSVPGGAIIKLSQPLLSLRPSKDLKMVLLHEMIHAYCMVNKIRDRDPTGHGPPFQKIMNEINSSTVFDYFRPSGGYNISVYHTMVDEVEYYRQHHWKCERCGREVHRAMNRKPQEADCRYKIRSTSSSSTGQVIECRDTRCSWHMHLRDCGGEYVKIKEPEEYTAKNNKMKKKKKGGDGDGGSGSGFSGQRQITGWLNPAHPSSTNTTDSDATLPAIDTVLKQQRGGGDREKARPPSVSAEERRALFEAAALRRAGQGGSEIYAAKTLYSQNLQQSEVINLVDEEAPSPAAAPPSSSPPPPSQPLQTGQPSIRCPVCGKEFPANDNGALNSHLDDCLAFNSL